MSEKPTALDPVGHADSEQAIAGFMEDAFESGEPACIAQAPGIAARFRDMTEIARQPGLPREQLYRSFGREGNPTLRSTLAVKQALGIRICTKQAT